MCSFLSARSAEPPRRQQGDRRRARAVGRLWLPSSVRSMFVPSMKEWEGTTSCACPPRVCQFSNRAVAPEGFHRRFRKSGSSRCSEPAGCPTGLAIDQSDNLVVADACSSVIQRFSAPVFAGTPGGGELPGPHGLGAHSHFGNIRSAAAALGLRTVRALRQAIDDFCTVSRPATAAGRGRQGRQRFWTGGRVAGDKGRFHSPRQRF